MDLSTEKQRPQLVEVVNNSDNPTDVNVTNLPLIVSGDNQYVGVQVRNSVTIQGFRPLTNSYNVALDNILLLQSDGGFFAVPLNTTVTNLTSAQINNLLDSYKTAYATLVSGVTAATLHYSKMASSGVTTSEVYNLKD